MKLGKTISALLFAFALVFCLAVSASAEGGEALTWYPLFYDDGDFYETVGETSAPADAEAKVVSAYAEEQKDGSYLLMRYTGEWAKDEKTGVCTPIYESEGTPLYTVTRSVKKKDGFTCSVTFGGKTASDLFFSTYHAEDGDRIVMQDDFTIPYEGFEISEEDAVATETGTTGGKYIQHSFFLPGEKAVEFDVAGHTLNQPYKFNVFSAYEDGTTFRLFSSKPGGLITERDVLGNEGTGSFNWSGRIMSVDSGGADVIIGSCCGYEGSNLTLRAGVIFNCGNGKAEDKRGNLVIDGITAHGCVNDSSALFIMRTVNSSLTVKNCTIYTTAHKDDGTDAGRCIVNLQDDGISGLTKLLTMDNCRIYQKTTSNIANTISSDATFRITNTIGNYCLAASTLQGTLSVGAGNAYTVSSDSQFTKDPGLFTAQCRYPIVCNYVFPDPYAFDKTAENFDDAFDYYDVALVLNTSSCYGTGYETVNVTWASADGKYQTTEEFLKGGSAVYTGTRIVTEDVHTKLTSVYFLGWDHDLSSLTEDAVVKPLYRIEANVAGLKQSVTFSTDFTLNLYIPESDGIGAVTDANGKNLKLQSAEIGEKSYYLVSLPISSNAAEQKTLFRIEILDGDVEAVQEVNLCLLSYAKELLENEETEQSERELIASAMLYAKASSLYFNGSVGSDFTAVCVVAETVLENVEAPETNAVRLAKNDYVSAAALELDANPDFIFYLKDGFNGTLRLSYPVGKKTVKVSKSVKEGDVSVLLENPGIRNLTATVKIEAAKSGTSEYVTVGEYNLSAYVEFCESGAVSEGMKNLANALWLYANLAKNAK